MQYEKRTLSQREKRLLLVAVAVVMIAVMVQFVILPLNNRLGELRDQYDALDEERATIELKLASEQSKRDSNAQARARYEEISDLILNESQSNEIGRMLTTLCRSKGLEPSNQRLSEPAVYVITKTETDAATGQSTEVKEETAFLTVMTVMNVESRYGELKSLLDEVEDIPYIRVSRVSFTRDPDTEALGPVTIEFEVTMLSSNEELGIRN